VPSTGDPLDDVRSAWWAYYEFSKESRELFELMFVDRSVPQITERWEGFAFVQQMLDHAYAKIQRCIDAGVFPSHQQAGVLMHVLWSAMTGPAVIGSGCRLAKDEDPDALARDVLSATLAGFQSGVSLSFIPCSPLIAGALSASSTSGVVSHES
jgi:hypothetical protein